MSPIVSQFAPRARVTFYCRSGEIIDVSNDLYSVTTKNGIGRSTGVWSCSLTGRKVGGKTFAERIQAQDYVEIELARVPSAGGSLILTMRGFVDIASRSQTATSRSVSISGRNYGKLLQRFQVYFLNEMDPASNIVPESRLDQTFGIGIGMVTWPQFVAAVRTQIIDPNLASFRAANSHIPDLRTVVSIPDSYAINGLAIQPFTGSVWNLLTQYADKPWIEVFTTDTPEGPTLHHRFAPLKGYDGAWLPLSTERPRTIALANSDIISDDTSVSDNEVYNYYFTYPTFYTLNRIAFKSEAISHKDRNPYLDEENRKIYGFAPLEIGTSLIPSVVPDPPDAAKQIAPELVTLSAQLNQWLIAAFEDNARYENGPLVIKGGGGIQPGEYVSTEDGRELYISEVTQTFNTSTDPSFTTTLDLIRGRPATTERTHPG